jgi:hypothetical protein
MRSSTASVLRFFWSVCLFSTIHAASLRRPSGNTRRELLVFRRWRQVPVCQRVGTREFQTKSMGRIALFLSRSVVKGVCATMCDTLCVDYPSFNVTSNDACTCVDASPSTSSDPALCGANAMRLKNETCQCLPGFQGDATKNCTATIKKVLNPCHVNNPCPSNQLCINNSSSSSNADNDEDNDEPVVTCEPIRCATPFNPCGPGMACYDKPTGYTCTRIYGNDICPVGCSPNSSCVAGKCECNPGYTRPVSYLGCVPVVGVSTPP